jgi:polyhydroxyalkanoate synthesis regulator phasin
MFELIKKTILAGVGFAAITTDKVEQMVKEYIERGEITEKEGKEFVNDFMKKSEQANRDFEKKLEDMIKKVLKRKNIATREDVSVLEERIKAMEQKLTVSK